MPGLQPQTPVDSHMSPLASTFLTGFSSSHGDFKQTSAFASNFETR